MEKKPYSSPAMVQLFGNGNGAAGDAALAIALLWVWVVAAEEAA